MKDQEKPSELSEQHELFCQEYSAHLNGRLAYQNVYKKSKANTASVQAHKLLTKPAIQRRVQELKEERSNRLEVSTDRVILELAKLGFSDIRHYYNENGTIKKFEELDWDHTAAIKQIKTEVQEIQTPDGGHAYNILKTELQLHDKRGALELIGKHVGAFEADNKQKLQQLTGITFDVKHSSVENE